MKIQKPTHEFKRQGLRGSNAIGLDPPPRLRLSNKRDTSDGQKRIEEAGRVEAPS
jgi:hypothetical protein